MKRALALLAACSLFGFAGLAQFSGSWDVTLGVLPKISLESTFGLEYTYAGWVFSSTADFDDDTGFTSLLFSASGSFGPVSIESEMKFLPQASYTWTVYELETPQTPSCPLKKTKYYWNGEAWVTDPATFPIMDYWKTTLSVSLAGLDAELLMYQKGFDEFYGETWDLYAHGQPSGWYLWCADRVNTGTGWRAKVGGELNGVSLTSYTYFNLTETLDLFTDEGCPQLVLKGNYKIAEDDCGVSFTSELITFEGFSICCGATLNAALSIGCTGFDYLFVYVEDVPVFPWVNISPWVKFTIDEKQFGFCATPVTAAGCITVSPIFEMVENESHNEIANEIGGIILKEISLTCEFSECSSFSATTVLYDLKNNGLLVIDGESVPVGFDLGDPYGMLYLCKPVVKYIAWEKFSFSFCGPGCCGGNYEISIDTYFGKKYTLEWSLTPGEKAEEPLPGEKEEATCLSTDYTLASEAQLGTLFGWMETDVSATVPVSADISLTLDLSVSFQGIEGLDIGFSFQF